MSPCLLYAHPTLLPRAPCVPPGSTSVSLKRLIAMVAERLVDSNTGRGGGADSAFAADLEQVRRAYARGWGASSDSGLAWPECSSGYVRPSVAGTCVYRHVPPRLRTADW